MSEVPVTILGAYCRIDFNQDYYSKKYKSIVRCINPYRGTFDWFRTNDIWNPWIPFVELFRYPKHKQSWDYNI